MGKESVMRAPEPLTHDQYCLKKAYFATFKAKPNGENSSCRSFRPLDLFSNLSRILSSQGALFLKDFDYYEVEQLDGAKT